MRRPLCLFLSTKKTPDPSADSPAPSSGVACPFCRRCQRPQWLALAHQKLEEAVFAAYGWPASLTDDALLAKLLELNLARAK
jgi:hypothetical protein